MLPTARALRIVQGVPGKFLRLLHGFLQAQAVRLLRGDFVRTARAKGLRDRLVVMRHVLRNAWPPLVVASSAP